MRAHSAVGGTRAGGGARSAAVRQIEAIYQRHDPAKLVDLDAQLAKYGDERLLKMVRNHYAADRSSGGGGTGGGTGGGRVGTGGGRLGSGSLQPAGLDARGAARGAAGWAAPAGSKNPVPKGRPGGFSVQRPAPARRAAVLDGQRRAEAEPAARPPKVPARSPALLLCRTLSPVVRVCPHAPAASQARGPSYSTPTGGVALGGRAVAADPARAAVRYQQQQAAQRKVQQRQLDVERAAARVPPSKNTPPTRATITTPHSHLHTPPTHPPCRVPPPVPLSAAFGSSPGPRGGRAEGHRCGAGGQGRGA